MSEPKLSQRHDDKVLNMNVIGITDRLLQKSNSVLNKIEENIDLTSSLRKSNNLISQIDHKIDGLTGNLQQYQYYLSQLNSLLIRSEFFEAQLNMLEAHDQLDSLRSSEGMPSLNDWKDDDLNWRTTEATLENLYLEYQYLTKQMEQLQDPEAFKAVLMRQFNPAPVFDEEVTNQRPTLQNKMSMADMKLKPMRIVSRKQEKQRRNSLELNKKRPVASIPTIYRPQTQPQTKNVQSLPTPETSFDNTMGDTTTDYFNYQDDSMVSPLSNIKRSSSRRNSHATINKHTRSSSLPESIVSNMLDTVKFNLAEDPLSPENTKNRKFSLRHFISHETGLKTRGAIMEEDEEDVKDSEFLNSPVSIHLESFLKPKPTIASKGKELEEPIKESMNLEEDPHLEKEEVAVFEHKLNRSNSCDSIFSTMKTEPYIPLTDNKQQTMNWMKQFSKPQNTISTKESNVTTLSVNNLSSSISSPSRKALTDLVTQNSSVPKPTPANRFPFLFASKKSSPLAATSDGSSSPMTSPIATSTSSPFYTEASTAQSIPMPARRQLSVDDSSSYHSFEASYSNSPQHKQWSLLLDRFKPKAMVPSSSLVTSEVGRPIPRVQPIKINHQDNNFNKPHISSSLAPNDKIKGSFSTLTIGPNRSKIVQHGESSTLGQSLVISSKVSHAALKEALNNDFSFE
ncbi:Serine/threonine-protein kinase [Wickerhamomyces ciferrii]|uniref:Serine/threonine-protein kinase n=1 Tax=Wickerhamomyces ciferrii (strain ATCC 14091 / BCRC 22168 / CBS 111 / JCM 3599 / NBRC 0793 / NRRL Y-1031 F-60-10) TaxID=1206466 RepID=K0KF97_WICCF|nr:Serine/threonine-protein kinase [Wickerhamomyces ciferrii]CCH43780.1 Serine/threonine-protein kinase [Wickerhamomyces ciferrii]